MQKEAVALVVNAGGQSRRMGRVKALLPVPPDGEPLVCHVVKRLLPLVTERAVVVTNDVDVGRAVMSMSVDSVQVVGDQWAGGALGGVASGLSFCSGWAMVVACDMPFAGAELFATLIRMAHAEPNDAGPKVDAFIPRVDGQAQPFHGLWHRRALPRIAARLTADQLGVQAALDELEVRWVGAEELGIGDGRDAFLNANTPQEWAEILTILTNKKA
jgi:molybdopterin-guanine dinucleotide biosynthesis protein A